MDFGQYNLAQELVSVLNKHGYHEMSAVQSVVIPKGLKGESLIVQAKTGSGKTHSFLIPLLARLEAVNQIQAIVLVPTRELARQVYDFAVTLNNDYKHIDILLLAGGLEKARHKARLSNKPALIIATPGRFHDLMLNEDVTTFKTIHTVILDEGDMLLDGGFYTIIEESLNAINPGCIQLFSATIPQKLVNLVTKRTGVKTIIDVDRQKTSEGVDHFLIDVHHQDRFAVALDFIKTYNPYLLLIFASTNKEVLALYDFLRGEGLKIGLLTGELESRKRKAMFRRVKDNEFQVIVASDIAARGIDIADVSHVLSISFPYDLEFYYHRAGRTGRNNNSGLAYTMYDHDDLKIVDKLEAMGSKFTRLVYQKGQFTPGKMRVKARKVLSPEEASLELKIKKTVATTTTSKVRPGYKKKVQKAVERVKKSHKRQVIKKSIKEQRRKNKEGGRKDG